jgi:hypothetical protein
MVNIGYTRVSTLDQNTERQDLGPVERLFTDKASGKNLERPQLQAMLDYIRTGDTVKVYSIDRLARSTKDLLELVGVITAKGCRLEFVADNLQFGGQDDARNELMLTMLGAFATCVRRKGLLWLRLRMPCCQRKSVTTEAVEPRSVLIPSRSWSLRALVLPRLLDSLGYPASLSIGWGCGVDSYRSIAQMAH